MRRNTLIRRESLRKGEGFFRFPLVSLRKTEASTAPTRDERLPKHWTRLPTIDADPS
jgi:hypothetical protein